jgi:bifunctional DNA-binding transcriptional regulator/antitoxin component of YhaV-PrlF toxin-antitoxin module
MKVTTKGQVTIPQHLRRKYQIDADAEVDRVSAGAGLATQGELLEDADTDNRLQPLHRVAGYDMADLMGVESHGVQRLTRYTGGIKLGSVNTKAKMRVINQSTSTALIDGDAGLGQATAHKAMELAIEKAEESGVSIVREACFIKAIITLQAR